MVRVPRVWNQGRNTMGRMRGDDDGPMDRNVSHLDRGWDLALDGDLEEAMKAAERALRSEGDSPEVHTLLGYIQQMAGQPDEALRHYRQALALDEMYLDAMIRATEVLLHQLDRRDEGMALADEALELCETADERADVLLLKIEALLDDGNVESAAEVASELPEGPFESPQMPFHVGRARFDVGDVTGAEASLFDAKEREPSNPEVHYYIGLLHETRREEREATISFLRSLQCDARLEPLPGTLAADQFEKRIRTAMKRLRTEVSTKLEDALIVPAELPGVEVVAEGVDPRTAVLIDDAADEDGGRRIARLFIYQRNVERFAGPTGAIVDEIVRAVEREVAAVFPEIDRPAS